MTRMFAKRIGPGSEERQLEPFQSEFPKLIEKYDIKTVNDAGCGKGWIREFDIEYRGYDILERPDCEVLDITSEVMPEADLIVCRDVLFHLTTDLILSALENFRKSGSTYLLATSRYDAKNSKIPKGIITINARNDLTKSPFSLGEPIEKIEEPLDNRFLGLWRLT